MMKYFLSLLLCGLAASPAISQVTGSGTATASLPMETTNTMQLMTQASMSFPACGLWHSSGICFFLRCGWHGCHIETSERYSHMAADLVVSTYQDLDNHPWPEIGKPMGQINLRAASLLLRTMIGDGSGTFSKPKRNTNKNVKYRDADAIGHPGGVYVAPHTCPRAARAMESYYSAFPDAMAWRNFLPVDLLQVASWVPGMREIGSFPLNTWGNVMPRTGWHTHQHDVKVAAVLSQRVADIVTRPGEAHVYTQLSSGGITHREGQIVWDPPPAQENQLTGGQWQMSAPFVGSPSSVCHVFGENDSGSPIGYGDFATSTTESYAYTLWRPYGCCSTRGIFLYAVIWGMW